MRRNHISFLGILAMLACIVMLGTGTLQLLHVSLEHDDGHDSHSCIVCQAIATSKPLPEPISVIAASVPHCYTIIPSQCINVRSIPATSILVRGPPMTG